ncbi:MAG: PQ-loop domain-containing transporter [candidate division FCPU426 bacterium]
MPGFNWWAAVGVAAAALTSTSFVPQLLLRLRRPDAARMSFGTLGTFLAGVTLWGVYGIYLRDWIIIGANLFIFLNLAAIAIVQIVQEKKK